MAIEVTVGPPLVTINHGSTFTVSEPDAITPHKDQGIFSRDTRYVSSYEFLTRACRGNPTEKMNGRH